MLIILSHNCETVCSLYVGENRERECGESGGLSSSPTLLFPMETIGMTTRARFENQEEPLHRCAHCGKSVSYDDVWRTYSGDGRLRYEGCYDCSPHKRLREAREAAERLRQDIERARLERERQWVIQVEIRKRFAGVQYRGRKRRAKGFDYTTADHIKARCEMWGDRCYLCGAPMQAIDHVIPLAKGGTHWPANLRPICRTCNSKKRDRWPYDLRPRNEVTP